VKLLSWNIQWCRGMDGRVDPERIARTAKALRDPEHGASPTRGATSASDHQPVIVEFST
jgi:endonuclease/exonuclease/phosphatase family metal-dependent hydrolase